MSRRRPYVKAKCFYSLLRCEFPERNWLTDTSRCSIFTIVRNHLERVLDLRTAGCTNDIRAAEFNVLHNAVRCDNVKMVKELLRNNFPVNDQSKDGLTALHIAAYRGHPVIIHHLLKHGASINSVCTLNDHDFNPLKMAIIRGRSAAAKLILRHELHIIEENYKCPFRRYNANPIFAAMNTYILIAYLDRGNRNRKTCLLDTVDDSMYEYQAILHHLLIFYDKLPDFKDMVRILLHKAVEFGFDGIVSNLLNWGADLDIIHSKDYRRWKRGYFPLHTAARHNQLAVATLLLDQGACLIARDYYDMTPLHVAAAHGHLEIVRKLLSYRVDEIAYPGLEDSERSAIGLNYRADNGDTALFMAAKRGHYNVVEMLLAYGADVESINDNGLTVLCVALTNLACSDSVENNYESIARLLLNYGADVNKIKWCACLHGKTPDLLKELIIEMKVAGMYVKRKFDFIIKNPLMNDYRRKCEEEIESLKRKKCGDTTVSYYDILTRDAHRFARMYRNPEIVEAVDSADDDEMFPIYMRRINVKIHNGRERHQLMSRGQRAFDFLIGYEFCDVFTENMLHYLSNDDLLHLDQAAVAH